jgi:hypothetical protein
VFFLPAERGQTQIRERTYLIKRKPGREDLEQEYDDGDDEVASNSGNENGHSHTQCFVFLVHEILET